MQYSEKKRFVGALSLAVALCIGSPKAMVSGAATPEEVKAFLAKIQDANADARYAAWKGAGLIGAPAVLPLAKLLTNENKGIAKAASEALSTIAHHASRPGADEERRAVSKELAGLLDAKQPHVTRVKALALLALTACDDCVPRIASFLQEEKLRDEVRRTLERIPGKASVQALMDALKTMREEFRPAILHSLAQKNAAEALDAIVDCAESPNKEIAIAAYQAISRIDGVPSRRPQAAVAWSQLSEREKMLVGDAFLRFADKRAAAGDTKMSLGIYRAVLGRTDVDSTQEHFKCAALIGLGKYGSVSDVPLMISALAHESAAVRHVAEEALVSMGDPGVNSALEQASASASPESKTSIAEILFRRQPK